MRSISRGRIAASRGARACVLAALAALVVGCDLRSPLEGVGFKINFAPAPTIVSLAVVNAASGLPAQGEKITITLVGPAAARSVDGAGAPTTRFTLESGFLSFGLKGGVPTESAPVEVTLVVEGPGLLTSIQRISVRSAESAPARIPVVKLANPPRGTVAAEQKVSATSGGALTAAAVVATPRERNSGGAASIAFPAGTVIRDAAGTPLSGRLTGTLVYFNNQDESALRAFPGGLLAQVSNLAGGPMAFTPAGLVSAELVDERGAQAASFSQPVLISMAVADGTVHPRLGRRVEAGDTIPIWSFRPGDRRWAYEGRATLVAAPSGGLAVSIPVRHFSYWSISWFSDAGALCASTAPIRLTGKPASILGLPLNLYNARSGRWIRDVYAAADNDQITIPNVERNLPLRVVARHPLTGDIVGDGKFDNACAGGQLALTAADLRTMTGTANVKGLCPNGVEIRPTIPIYSRNLTRKQQWYSFAANMVNGRATVGNLIVGHTYEFSGTVVLKSGEYKGTHTYVAGKDPEHFTMTMKLPASVC